MNFEMKYASLPTITKASLFVAWGALGSYERAANSNEWVGGERRCRLIREPCWANQLDGMGFNLCA